MPRYFFHLLEQSTNNLVRDSEGAFLPNAAAAKKEAIGLARDIVAHGLPQSTWHVIVMEAIAGIVLAIPLSEIHAPKIKAWIDLAHRIAAYQPKLRSHVFTWLLTALVLAMIAQAAMLSRVSRSTAESFSAKVDLNHGTAFSRTFDHKWSLIDRKRRLSQMYKPI